MIDLRSDTVTRPTPAMRAAMAAAEVGDDVFGDDPTVNALQARMAALTGHEAALLMPSGTQSNLCALLAHCGRGDEYLVGQMAHCYRYEGGGAAVLGGIQPQPLPQDAQGVIALADLAAAVKPDDEHFARTRLLCLENTWNGHPLPAAYRADALGWAKGQGLATHLDGARVFNAAAHAAGPGGDITAALRAITAPFDSVSVCCSKGLGAPVGSLLCGSQAFIAQARRWRKVVGGGMRQVGLLAAAIDHALSHHVERLHDDHARAARLAEGLRTVPGVRVRSAATNIVFIDVADGRGRELLSFLAERGILATGLIGMRMVTHLGIDDAAIDTTVAAVRECLSRPPHNPT
ncbi:MAG: low-specificity L-threonine aldolase [Rubrivivax sp.]|jgi:threonine aldolase